MIAVVDYGSGNTGSLTKALDHIGLQWSLADKPETIEAASAIVFPGVGAFGPVMGRLGGRGLVDPLREAVLNGKPFLGICIGLQLLFDESEESPGVAGLALLRGRCVRFKSGKVPQIGWNEIRSSRPGLLASGHYYFVNSYRVAPDDEGIVLASSDYHGLFVAAVIKDNIVATQFHPEKSGGLGLAFLRNWADAR